MYPNGQTFYWKLSLIENKIYGYWLNINLFQVGDSYHILVFYYRTDIFYSCRIKYIIGIF